MPLDTKIFTKMVGRVAAVTRSTCVMPRCVNLSYAAELSQRGFTVDVPIVGTKSARNITPAVTAPATDEPTPSFATVTLDRHQEAAFILRETDLGGLDDPQSYVSRELESCGAAIAEAVNSSIFELYRSVPHRAGTAGTTPFASSTQALQDAERVLISNRVNPLAPRKLILDPFAHANALGLSAFQNAMAFQSAEVIKEGRISRALGYDWNVDQQAPQHTRGVATGTPTVNGAQAAGTANLVTNGWTNSITGILLAGDIITIAGDPNPYVVTADVNSGGTGAATIPISPGIAGRTGLLLTASNGAAITVVASHRVSLAVSPDFAAFASRVYDQPVLGQVGFRTNWVDPVSGLVLTVMIREQHYQTYFAVSCLWGRQIVRPEYACRLMG